MGNKIDLRSEKDNDHVKKEAVFTILSIFKAKELAK